MDPAAAAGRSSCWFWGYRPRGEGRRRLQEGGVGVQSAEALDPFLCWTIRRLISLKVGKWVWCPRPYAYRGWHLEEKKVPLLVLSLKNEETSKKPRETFLLSLCLN